MIQAIRDMTYAQIEAAVHANSPKSYDAYMKAKKYVASADAIRLAHLTASMEATNAATAAWSDVAPASPSVSLVMLWTAVESTVLAISARPALTQAEYHLLVQPMLGVLPHLADPGQVIEEIDMPAYPKEQQTGRPAKAKAEKTPKPPKPAKVAAEKPVVEAKAKVAKVKASAPKTPAGKAAKKQVTPTSGAVPAIVTEALEFTLRHPDQWEDFRTGKMGYVGGAFMYTCESVIDRVLGKDARLALDGKQKAAVGFLLMATLAAEGDEKFKATKAWSYWEPLATLATKNAGKVRSIHEPLPQAVEPVGAEA